MEEGSSQATEFQGKRIRRGWALGLGSRLSLSSDSTSEMRGGTRVSWCMHPDCNPQVTDQNEDMREGWGLEGWDLTHPHWQPQPPPWASFPQIKEFCYSNFHPHSPTAHSLHPFFWARTALVFKLCMVGEFQAAWLAQDPKLVGLEPNMLALFPGHGGGKVGVRELAHK